MSHPGVNRARLFAFCLAAGFMYSSGRAQAQDPEQPMQVVESRDYAQAEGAFVKLKATSPNCSSAYYLGVEQLRLKKIERAVKALNAASLCDPSMVQARLALGESYVTAGDDAKALRAYAQALEIEPKSGAALRGSALIYLKSDNNEKAIPLLQALIEVEPKDAEAHVNLGAAFAATNNWDSAKKEFETALRLQPDNASALTALGNRSEKDGDPDQAIVFAKRAIAAAPNAFEPYFVLGAAYSKLQNYAEARKALERALSLGGRNSPEVYYQLARIYANLNLTEEREAALKQFAELTNAARAERESRNEVFSLLEQSRSLVNAGDLKGAVVLLEKAHTLHSTDDQVLFRLAGLHYDLKQYDQARVQIDAAIEIAPTLWVYHFLRGLIAMDSEELREAQASLNLAERLNPAAKEVQSALQQLAAKRASQRAR